MKTPKRYRPITEHLNNELPPGMSVVFVTAEDESVDDSLEIRDHLGRDTGLHISLGCREYMVATSEDDDSMTIVKFTEDWRTAAEACVAKAQEMAS